jgi:hypothetical protein
VAGGATAESSAAEASCGGVDLFQSPQSSPNPTMADSDPVQSPPGSAPTLGNLISFTPALFSVPFFLYEICHWLTAL